jgi:hypothetical protein
MTRVRSRAPSSIAVLLSLLLHLAVLIALQGSYVRLPHDDLSVPIPVKILPPPPQLAKARPAAPAAAKPPPPAPPAPPPPAVPDLQLVNPSDEGEETAPDKTRFFSDRDNKVKEEMVRRGEPAPGEGDTTGAEAPKPEKKAEVAPASAAQAKPKRGEKPAHTQLASLPGLDRLLPDAVEIAGEDYGKEKADAKAESESQVAQRNRRGGSAWLPQSNRIGTLDYLPDVREGDITLLNTKAERFAPFVRRVALRVFQNLVISLRRDVNQLSFNSEESVTMKAVMNMQGDLVRTEITKRSPTIALGTDRRLQQACVEGFFDRNPPPEARLPDGNIHFLFEAQVIVLASPNSPQRGYAITMGAGLL